MHPLAHAWAKDRQSLEQQDQTWASTASIVALSLSNPTTMKNRYKNFLLQLHSVLNKKVKRALSLGPVSMILPIFIACSWGLVQNRDGFKLGVLLREIFDTLALNYDKPSMEYLPMYELRAKNLRYVEDYANFL